MIKIPTACIAAALLPSVALAELQSLDEFEMSDVAGQSGITMEMAAQINIESIEYTDEGSLEINTISFGGSNRDDLFQEGYMAANGGTPFIQNISDQIDDLKLDIDIDSSGEMSMKFYPVGYAAPVDFRITTEAWNVKNAQGATTVTLVDNFKMEGIFTQLWGKIGHDDTLGADRLNLLMMIGIDDMDFDIPFLGVGIRDFRMTRSDYDVNPNLLSANAVIETNIYNGTRADGGSALAVDLVSMDADITIGSIQLGTNGNSIGSVKFDNMTVTNSTMRIYGH